MGQVDSAVIDELKLFHDMRRLYLKQNWVQAELQLTNLQRRSPESELYKIYAERITYFRKNPPVSDWNGVYIFETK